MPGAAVLGDVGEQLGGAEVGDGLDRGRRALGQVDDELDRQVATRGQARGLGGVPVVPSAADWPVPVRLATATAGQP
jgi:hypothetical protein